MESISFKLKIDFACYVNGFLVLVSDFNRFTLKAIKFNLPKSEINSLLIIIFILGTTREGIVKAFQRTRLNGAPFNWNIFHNILKPSNAKLLI